MLAVEECAFRWLRGLFGAHVHADIVTLTKGGRKTEERAPRERRPVGKGIKTMQPVPAASESPVGFRWQRFLDGP